MPLRKMTSTCLDSATFLTSQFGVAPGSREALNYPLKCSCREETPERLRERKGRKLPEFNKTLVDQLVKKLREKNDKIDDLEFAISNLMTCCEADKSATKMHEKKAEVQSLEEQVMNLEKKLQVAKLDLMTEQKKLMKKEDLMRELDGRAAVLENELQLKNTQLRALQENMEHVAQTSGSAFLKGSLPELVLPIDAADPLYCCIQEAEDCQMNLVPSRSSLEVIPEDDELQDDRRQGKCARRYSEFACANMAPIEEVYFDERGASDYNSSDEKYYSGDDDDVMDDAIGVMGGAYFGANTPLAGTLSDVEGHVATKAVASCDLIHFSAD